MLRYLIYNNFIWEKQEILIEELDKHIFLAKFTQEVVECERNKDDKVYPCGNKKNKYFHLHQKTTI